MRGTSKSAITTSVGASTSLPTHLAVTGQTQGSSPGSGLSSGGDGDTAEAKMLVGMWGTATKAHYPNRLPRCGYPNRVSSLGVPQGNLTPLMKGYLLATADWS